MTCASWRGACSTSGYRTACVCILDDDHAGACLCPCGSSPPRPRCADCTDPCPCGRDAPPMTPREFLQLAGRRPSC